MVFERLDGSLCIFFLVIIGGTNWYLMFTVVMTIFNDVDSLTTIKWNPGFITQLFKSVVNYMEACIIYLSILFFIAAIRMELQ